jgi:hypothetical protein
VNTTGGDTLRGRVRIHINLHSIMNRKSQKILMKATWMY